MKHKLIAALLALTLVSWAQSTTPSPTPEQQQKSAPTDAKARCPCCADTTDHGDMHNGMSCMRHAKSEKDDKEAMSCCSKKDGKHSCCGKDMKACSKDGKAFCCADKAGDDCCSAKDGKTAHNCCDEKQCGKHHHHDSATPGN
jgi:hypothetical protein